MDFVTYITEKKRFYSSLLDFIENSDSLDFELKQLFDKFQKTDFFQNKEEILSLFQFLSKLLDNHHLTSDFFTKLEQIYNKYLLRYKQTYFSDSEIIQIYMYNTRSLYFLFQIGFIKPDNNLVYYMIELQNYTLYPILKTLIDPFEQISLTNTIEKQYSMPINQFEEKCHIFQNDSYICSLIREDSVEEFIAFVHKNNISLSSKIEQSPFETNRFLIYKKPTLIEYALFFGSIQIFQYLKYNNVPLEKELWLYAIHSNNAELIHLLEENNVEPTEKNFEAELKEAIICHHNNIADYIKDNFLDQSLVVSSNENKLDDSFDPFIIESLNFYFYPNDLGSIIMRGKRIDAFNVDFLCKYVTIINVPNDISSIGPNAFGQCNLLSSVIIPSSVTKICKNVFNNCPKLNEISFPSSVTKFEKDVFNGIKVLHITGTIKNIVKCMFYRYDSLTQLSLPSSVESIGEFAFAECPSLFEITIPSSIRFIDKGAFYNCKSLKNINYFNDESKTDLVVPFQLKSIEKNTYFGCSSLEKVEIPPFATIIGDYALSECFSLKTISIPPTVDSYGDYAFCCCSLLKEIPIPQNMLEIKEGIFYKCFSLAEITIPSSVISIGSFAFAECSSVISIIIPSSVKSIGNHSFDGCTSLKDISILSSVTKIGHNSFSRCSSLEKFAIPSSVTIIENHTFSDCSKLMEISIPDSVVEIGDNSFSGCSSLKQIQIPSSVKSIGSCSFNDCSSLTHITLPDKINTTKIGLSSNVVIKII